MMNKAIAEGNLAEAAKQITGNYEVNGKPAFSTDPGAKKVGNTDYFNQMSGDNKDVLTDGNRAFRHAVNLEEFKDWQAGVDQIAKDTDVSQFYGQRFDPTKIGTDPSLDASQPLQQTYVPPSIPTKDDILRAGGIDAYVESLPQDVDQKTTGLQDLPVGVSIEADGQFTGTGGLGAVQAPRVKTPIVKRDYELPGSLSEQEVMRRPTTFTGPTGAGIGPMSEDARLQIGLATDFNRFGNRRDFTTAPTVQPFVSPAINQTEAMLGGTGASGTLPQVGGTVGSPAFQNIIPPTRPQQRPLGLSPGAMGGRQLGMSPGAMGGRAAPPAPTPDFVFDYGFGTKGSPASSTAVATIGASQEGGKPTPKLETLKASSQTRDAATAQRARSNAQQAALDSGMSLSDSVDAGLRAEAETNLRVAAERNRKLNQGRTLTDVLEEEERESSGGGSSGGGGFGGGSTGGGGSSGEKKGTFCVIATHGLANGGFTKLEKAKAELWCEKKYHGKWYGEAFRRGYRAAGNYWIKEGTVQKRYQEFKDFVAYGRGVKKGFGLAVRYYLRTIQFFVTGLFISE
jgi:hypothetical protein